MLQKVECTNVVVDMQRYSVHVHVTIFIQAFDNWLTFDVAHGTMEIYIYTTSTVTTLVMGEANLELTDVNNQVCRG